MYKFIRDGILENVPEERWQWIAIYSDGTFLKQFDPEGEMFHQFKEIDQNKLVEFKMMPQSGGSPFTLQFEPGMKLIHYYDYYVLNYGTPNERRFRNYVFGYEKGQEKRLFTITEDDSLIISGEGVVLK